MAPEIDLLFGRADPDSKPTPLPAGGVLEAGGVRMDAARHRAWVLEAEVTLTVTEWRILWALLERPGEAVGHNALLALLRGGFRCDDGDGAVRRHVANLRRQLGEYRRLIETVVGVGYRLAEG